MYKKIKKLIKNLTVGMSIVILLCGSILSRSEISIYATETNENQYEYAWYSSIERAVVDANNLTTVNADSTEEDAEVGLSVDNNIAYLSVEKNIQSVQTLVISNNTVIDLKGNTVEMAEGENLQFNNNLKLYNGVLDFQDVVSAIKGNQCEFKRELLMNGVTINHCTESVFTTDLKTIDLSNTESTITDINIELTSNVDVENVGYAIYLLNSSAEINSCNIDIENMQGGSGKCIGINVCADSQLVFNDGNIDVNGNYENTGIYNVGKTDIYGGYIYAKPISNSSRGDARGSGIKNYGELTIVEKNDMVTVIGGYAGIYMIRGSDNTIDGGTFISPNHGGAYIGTGSSGRCEINGGTFKISRSLWTKEELTNITSFGGMYVGTEWDPTSWSVNIRNATITGGLYGLVQKSNNGYIPATINLYDCRVSGSGYDIFIQNNESVGTYNAYVNIYGNTRLVHNIILDDYEINYGISHINDYRVVENLQITSQPVDVQPIVGDNVEFNIEATGTELTYQWQLSKNNGETWQNTTTSTSKEPTLTFAMKYEYYGRQFRCIITDLVGNTITSNVCMIQMPHGPIIVSNPVETLTNDIGTAMAISFNVMGNGLTYQWQLSKDNGITWSDSTASTATNSILGFVMKATYHGRQFRCVVTDEDGYSVVTAPCIVYVTGGPVITRQPSNIAKSEGEASVVLVEATGINLSYQWQLSKDGGLTWTNSTNAMATSAQMGFTMKSEYDGRMFRCIVTDENGVSITSNPCTATLK